jgi:anthranilate phosphoribosyltransferase
VLSRLGTERAWVVHGARGLDELALDGESVVAEVVDGEVKIRTVTAAEAGLAPAPVDALRVVSLGDAVARVRSVLAGERGPARDVVCLNAGAALVVAGATDTLRAGAERAAAAIDDGRAAALLSRLVRFTSERAAARSAS